MPTVAAHRVVLAGPTEIVSLVSPEMLRLALLGKVVTVEDNVSLLPQDVLPAAEARPLVAAARRSLATTVGYAFTTALLTVTASAQGIQNPRTEVSMRLRDSAAGDNSGEDAGSRTTYTFKSRKDSLSWVHARTLAHKSTGFRIVVSLQHRHGNAPGPSAVPCDIFER